MGNGGRVFYHNVANLPVYLEVGGQPVSSVGISLILGYARRGESLDRKRVTHTSGGSKMLSNQPLFTWVRICPHPTLKRIFSPQTLWLLIV